MREKYSKYIAMGVTAFCVIAASILLFFAFYEIKAIANVVRKVSELLEPFFIGVVIAYLVTPLYNILVRNLNDGLCKKLKPRHANTISVALSLTLSMIAALLVVFGLVALVVPQFINSIIGIFNSLETYSNNFILWINDVFASRPELADYLESIYQQTATSIWTWVQGNLLPSAEALLDSMSGLGTVFNGVISGVKVVIRIVKDVLIGFIAAAYLLVAKKHMIGQAKKIIYGILPVKKANFLIYEFRYIHTIFGGFIRGKLLDSLIIGIMCFIGCTIFNFPYPVVVAVIVGVTNVIPFFGPFVGAIPCAVLILMVSPIKCLYFCIFILALQQFDGNVLGPKILGNTTGLSSFWVLFSIILFGGMFGFIGMIIAVPLFAVIYSLVSSFTNHLLSKRTLSLETKDYELLDHVEEDQRVYVHMKDPTRK